MRKSRCRLTRFLVGTSKLGPRTLIRPASSNWRMRTTDVDEFVEVLEELGGKRTGWPEPGLANGQIYPIIGIYLSSYTTPMDLSTASRRLQAWDASGRRVFTRRDLARLFPEDSARALNKGIARLVAKGLLERACRGVYLNPLARRKDSRLLEHVALALRRGEYNYLSLESALSEYGAISQIPLERLTVMTTGRKGEYRTPYGVIEFTHTARPAEDILANTVAVPDRPLRLATRAAAWRDLKRVGRNLTLVDREALDDEG